MPLQPSTKKSGTHGGRRVGAGRKKTLEKSPNHTRRLELSNRHAVHTSLRCVRRLRSLRNAGIYERIRRVLIRFLDLAEFRVVHISIQRNHLHFIVEAKNKRALSRGMQSLVIQLARAINEHWDRSGKVFAYRYGAKQIKTYRYARNALAYVLNNWRRHRADIYEGCETNFLDQFSSAVSFDGWTMRFGPPTSKHYVALPVSPPKTYLLREGWKLYGAIDPFERPATYRW
jgi:REP element-mobilizing transposase RayT